MSTPFKLFVHFTATENASVEINFICISNFIDLFLSRQLLKSQLVVLLGLKAAERARFGLNPMHTRGEHVNSTQKDHSSNMGIKPRTFWL